MTRIATLRERVDRSTILPRHKERRADPTFTLATVPVVPREYGDAPDPPPVESSKLPLVRPCRPGDLRGLREVPTVHRANQPESLLAPYSSLRHGIRSLWPFPAERTRMFVACADEQLIGYADFSPGGPDYRWLLMAVGSTPQGLANHAIEALVRFATVTAGENGVKRLYAKLPLDLPLLQEFRSLSFRPYAEEDIMIAQALPECAAPRVLRAQEQADTWAIHQLYSAATPRQVQYAEAYTSHFWDMNTRRGAATGVRGWVVEEGHQLSGYLRVLCRGDWYVIDVVVAPDRSDVLKTLLDGAAAFIGPRSSQRVYADIPTYLRHFIPEFESRGFKVSWQQQLLVKYTTATARAPLSEPVLSPVDARERVTKRVPTFMQQPRHEETVPPSR